jgi:hypothetical protein
MRTHAMFHRLILRGPVVATPFVLLAQLALAQETGGSIRGHVTAGDGAAMANVRVIARAPELTSHRETLTSSAGDYFFAWLPAGDYVVSFERRGLVTVRRWTRLSSLETVIADAVMVEAERAEKSIVVAVDPDSFTRSPAATDNYQQTLLDDLPVTGGLLSAMSLASGPNISGMGDALISLDGTPLHLGDEAGRPLLDPGAIALQEATILTSAIPPQAGRLDSALIGVVTREGGDRLSGALTTMVGAIDRNADFPGLARETDGPATDAEYRLGGPLDGRRTWIFASGRNAGETIITRARLSELRFPSRTRERFWELKGTHALNQDHRLHGSFLTGVRDLRQVPPARAESVEDTAALEDRELSHRLVSGRYTGVLRQGPEFNVRLTSERFVDQPEGEVRSGLVARTPVRDLQTGSLISAPGTCAGCPPEEDTTTGWHAAASHLMSTSTDVHRLTVGYESSWGRLRSAGVPDSGSFELLASRFVVREGQAYPVLEPNGSSAIIWRPAGRVGFLHRSRGFFFSDEWQRGPSLTIHAGLRWDRHSLSTRDTELPILTESGISPRLSIAWSPREDNPWVVSAGYARYAGDLLHQIDRPLVGAAERGFLYRGPALNTVSSREPEEAAVVIDRAFDWLFANGGTGRAPSFAFEPGLSVVQPGVTRLPHTAEWTAGSSQQVGDTQVRADFIWRRAGNLREWRVDGRTSDAAGLVLDQARAVESTQLSRSYAALVLQLHRRLGIQAQVAARYTLSRLWGTAEGLARHENPFSSVLLGYPEYVETAWAVPSGDLADDRRHRLKFWGHADVLVSESLGVIGVDLLQTFESGRPFGLASWVDVSLYASNPGYLQPPAATLYYFTPRDEFRTKSTRRTDLSAKYWRILPGTVRTEVFVQFEVLNLFAKRRNVDPRAFAVAITSFTDPRRFAPFDPFSESPRPEVHWAVDSRLSGGQLSVKTTMPRALRLSVGIKF